MAELKLIVMLKINGHHWPKLNKHQNNQTIEWKELFQNTVFISTISNMTPTKLWPVMCSSRNHPYPPQERLTGEGGFKSTVFLKKNMMLNCKLVFSQKGTSEENEEFNRFKEHYLTLKKTYHTEQSWVSSFATYPAYDSCQISPFPSKSSKSS